MRGQRRVRAAYNSGRDANTMLLERLIPQYDKGSQVNMIQECSRFLHKAQALDLARASDDKAASTIVPWTVRGAYHEPSFYTIKFSSPVVQYIPPVFASLHLRRWYSRQRDVEYIPSYLVNLNRVVLSKSYLKRPSPNTQDTVGDGLFSRLDFVGGMRTTLSSTNLLLPGGAKPQVQRSLQDAIRMCFEHCWWLPPAPGGWTDASFANNMAYHSSKRVTGIVKLHKTLVRIIGKSRSETIRIVPGGKAVRCVNADVALLVDDGKDLLSERRRMLMTEGAASSVAEGTVMNAVIAVQDIGNPKTSLIMGHATGAMRPGCVQPAVSLSIWQILRRLRIDSGLTFVGETSVITEHVSRMLDNNTAESGVFYPDYIWRFTRNDAEKADRRPLSPVCARGKLDIPNAACRDFLSRCIRPRRVAPGGQIHPTTAQSGLAGRREMGRKGAIRPRGTRGWRRNVVVGALAFEHSNYCSTSWADQDFF